MLEILGIFTEKLYNLVVNIVALSGFVALIIFGINYKNKKKQERENEETNGKIKDTEIILETIMKHFNKK